MAFKNINPTNLGYVSAVLAAIMFGSVSTAAKPALSSVHPILLASFVYLLAALVVTPLVHEKKISYSVKNKAMLLAIALSGAVIGPIMFFSGLKESTASDSALLLNGETIFSVFLALLLFRERLPRVGYVAIGLMIVGIVIITTDMKFLVSAFDIQNVGNVLIIGSTVFWALDNNIGKILSTKLDAARIVQLKSIIGGSILLLVVFLFKIPIDVQVDHIPNILILGAAGFGGSIFLFIHGLKRIGTVKTVTIFSTSSVFGLIFAFLFL
jgi:drug/metabolite transporter (DMT)-like permease